jgi:hypothetical protein
MSKELELQFQQLDQILTDFQSMWRLSPFIESRREVMSVESIDKQIRKTISNYSTQQVSRLKSDSCSGENYLGAEFTPVISAINKLITIVECPDSNIAFPAHYCNGIPGRKQQQISRFVAAAVELEPNLNWLEWCSGKGYLGRLLHFSSAKAVTSLEYQGQLCDAGQAYALEHELPITFHEMDVLSSKVLPFLNVDSHAVALHACGDLHHKLIELGATNRISTFSVSPCCYHLINTKHYQPLSKLARESRLRLSKSDLRIPLQETITGGERVVRHRKTEMTFRLALDELLLNEMGYQEYVSVPSIKKSLLSEGFEAFCQWAAEKKQITLPECDWDKYLADGEKRFLRMEQLSLVIKPFMRALEVWLALDKALYLREHQFDVQLKTFCAKEITPRNLLLLAKK